jgi:hypothetical protein
MPREAGRNPSFSDPSILLPKHRDVPFPLGPRRVPSAGPFPSQPPRGRLGAGAADQAENLVQHISGKGWQNRSPASPTGHIPSLEAFPKEYLRIPLHRDAVLRSGHRGPLDLAPFLPLRAMLVKYPFREVTIYALLSYAAASNPLLDWQREKIYTWVRRNSQRTYNLGTK